MTANIKGPSNIPEVINRKFFTVRMVMFFALISLIVSPMFLSLPVISIAAASSADHSPVLASIRHSGGYYLAVLSWNGASAKYEVARVVSSEGHNAGTPAVYEGVMAFTMEEEGKYDIHMASVDQALDCQFRNVTSHLEGHFSDPSFIDSRQIALSGNVKGRNSLFLLDLDSMECRDLTPDFVNAGQPSALPGLPFIVFTGIASGSPIYNGNTDIYSLDLKDGKIRRITDGNTLICEGHPFLYSASSAKTVEDRSVSPIRSASPIQIVSRILISAASGSYSGESFMVKDSNIASIDPVKGELNLVTSGSVFKGAPSFFNEETLYLAMDRAGERNLHVCKNGRSIPLTDGLFIASFCFCPDIRLTGTGTSSVAAPLSGGSNGH
jgi:hypothetical protein